MVVKFFGNKKGGSTASIDYLLNERKSKGTAKLLQGDEKLTRDIINSISFKQKTTVGCLSFEEKDISQDLKYKLMQDFEAMLLPGMQDRYNILWVEHIDKGRLELNFVIPKIDLESQKSLNPYFHKADLKRVELWQDLTNLENSFTNPKDPKKERSVEINSHIKKFNESYEQLNETIQELASQGQIQNREQLIELLRNSGIEVTRAGKDYISVKMPDSKKARKFKGGIYEQQFTSIAEIETISERAEQRVREYNSRDTGEEIKQLRAKLNELTQAKIEYYGKRFKRDNQKEELSTNRDNSDIDSTIDFGSAMDNIRKAVERENQNNDILHTNERLENDSTGNATIDRIRREQQEHKRNSRELLSSFERERESKQGITEAISNYAEHFRKIAEKVIETAKRFIRKSSQGRSF